MSSAPEAGGGQQITACVPGAGCWSEGRVSVSSPDLVGVKECACIC